MFLMPCPLCGSLIIFPGHCYYDGWRGECPECAQEFIVPKEGPAAGSEALLEYFKRLNPEQKEENDASSTPADHPADERQEAGRRARE